MLTKFLTFDVRCIMSQVLYGETPSNPVNTILDLEGLGKLANELRNNGHGPLVTIVDSTYASPYLQKPIQYGIDLVAHSGLVELKKVKRHCLIVSYMALCCSHMKCIVVSIFRFFKTSAFFIHLYGCY